MRQHVLGLDIGSNSVGSTWIDRKSGQITTGVSVFPAGVDEADDKRGEPKNAKRRMTRRTRITLARRSSRKRALRLKLIEGGLLPADEAGFKALLETNDPWALRRRGLDEPLSPHEFGRALLHLAQRRGALGLKLAEPEEGEEESAESKEDGKVKQAVGEVRAKMLARKARTFGEFIAMVRGERVTPIESEDQRKPDQRRGPREWRQPVRNKAASYEHCADRMMIRDEFSKLWDAQKRFSGDTAKRLTNDLRTALDNEKGDGIWRHQGLLFGQRRASWDLGTLGRCVLEPSERCVPQADMHASRYLVIETVNNLRIIDGTNPPRPLTAEERERIKAFLSGPLGMLPELKKKDKKTGKVKVIPERPKGTVSVLDLRGKMAEWYGKTNWPGGAKRKLSPCRFNIEADEERSINTDWFCRAVVHGAIGMDGWSVMPESLKEGINRAILRFDPDEEGDAAKLRMGVMKWGGLDAERADKLVEAWKGRPRLDANRLNMSRKAVRNLLTMMDQSWPDERSPIGYRWPTQIEARKSVAGDADFRDVTTGKTLDDATRRRYSTGAKGATARDRYYMSKHILTKDGKPVIDRGTGEPLAEPPPAPLVSNPVVRKAIHEVRRHIVEYMLFHGRRPDEVYVELAREAKMGKKDADRVLARNRLRERIRKNIIDEHDLGGCTTTQQRAAVDRVVLCVQQDGICPLCGNQAVTTRITPRMAAAGDECEIAHIIPRASGGHNGLSNIVLSHTKCNRDMGRRTPRQLWGDGTGFDNGMLWIQGIYGEVKRAKPSEIKSAKGDALWACYFNGRDDKQKIERFKTNVSDASLQAFTYRQDAATKYAARQVMAYISDALFAGKGLPERATGAGRPEDERRIFNGDGLWTSRLRREWELFFDPHNARSHNMGEDEKQVRKEKNRGDHHHHAIDAVVVALCSREVQLQWEKREREGDAAYREHISRSSISASYDGFMESYRRQNRIRPPAPFDFPGLSADEAIETFRATVERAVFGEDGQKPICHRAVKRKLVGALHKETLFGPVLDSKGELTGNYTAKKSVFALDPNHLRLPRPEVEKEALDRLARRRVREKGIDEKEARQWAREVVASPGYQPLLVDPPPGMSGIVRDLALRKRLRECLTKDGLDPDNFTANELKKLCDAGRIKHRSGVPIRSVVLLRTMGNPVIIQRKQPEYASNRMIGDSHPNSLRAYDSQNNHHIEIRESSKAKWKGEIVSGYEAANRKLAKLRAFRVAHIPRPSEIRALKQSDKQRWKHERDRWRPIVARIEATHPLVDRTDRDDKGGRFVMSLCEGEMLWMKHKETKEVGYFVVAKMSDGEGIVLVPHWDARAAGERKDAEGKKVPNSKREQFAAKPSDLRDLAPPGHLHARKVRVSPLGGVTILDRD